MRLVVLTFGSQGDVAPFVALGHALAVRGHTVRVAAHAQYRELVERAGLQFHPVPGGPELALENPGWPDLLNAPLNNPFARARALHAVIDPHLPEMGPDVVRPACEDADGLVFNPAMIAGHGVAEELGIPSVLATVTPFHPTRAFPHPLLAPNWRAGPLANRMSYLLAERLGLQGALSQPLRPHARRRVGFSPWPLGGPSASWPPFPVLHGVSEALLPRPRDWPAHLELTGFWFFDSKGDSRLPDPVREFLDAGPPPVFVGFGPLSTAQQARMPEAVQRLSRRLQEIVAEGIRKSQRRMIVAAGAVPDRAATGFSDRVLVVDYLPFDLLFPHVDGIVHRGGVGTLALGLRAGRPSLVVPLVFDQFFWGRRAAAIGAGPPPVPAVRLTPKKFVEGLAALERDDIRAAALRAQERIQAENGLEKAALAIEQRLQGAGRRLSLPAV